MTVSKHKCACSKEAISFLQQQPTKITGLEGGMTTLLDCVSDRFLKYDDKPKNVNMPMRLDGAENSPDIVATRAVAL